MPVLSYRSYGKINIYLDVLDRRPDGFTNIETVLQSISLCDRLTVEPVASGIHMTCSDPGLSAGPDNLVYRAAVLMQQRAGTEAGVGFHLEKNLPVAAGLAGGSGNAAAALIALNELWHLNWNTVQLCEVALELGSDVPFCVVGGTVAATGRGELMTFLPPLPSQWLVLVHPPLAVTAGHAYGHPQLTRNTTAPMNGKTPEFDAALTQLAAGNVAEVIFNRMESGVLCDHPELAAIKTLLLEHGCVASAMSGSGPTVFGLCADEESARQIASQIGSYKTTVVCTVDQGVDRD